MRVTVTAIEAFRLYKTEDWMSFDDLMHQLVVGDPQNFKMAAGSAFHKVLERARYGDDINGAAAGRFVFHSTDMQEEIVLRALRETRAQKVYLINGTEVEVRGRTDGFDGITVDDHKLKLGKEGSTGAFDAESYADSYQWRLYLDMFGGRIFNYNVFTAKAEKGDVLAWEPGVSCAEFRPASTSLHGPAPSCLDCRGAESDHTPIHIELREYHPLRLYAYDGLNADVIAMLAEYVDFAGQFLTEEGISAWGDRARPDFNPGK